MNAHVGRLSPGAIILSEAKDLLLFCVSARLQPCGMTTKSPRALAPEV